MAEQLIAERVVVGERYTRAVDIARDVDDPNALSGYVATPRARDALLRLAHGLSPLSSQRAFRITGPYGAGKSAFGLLISKGVLGDDPESARVLERLSPGVTLPRHQPVILVGRRTSLAREIARALAENARTLLPSLPAFAERAQAMLSASQGTMLDSRKLLDLLGEMSQEVHAHHGMGLLLVIDEMGRFLEYASTNPSTEDPSLFQQLAERAAGRAHPDLAVLALLHHRFDDYLAETDSWAAKEWARSAERYEEIVFSEPREQSLHLLAQALCPERPHSKAVTAAAETLFLEAAARGMMGTAAGQVGELAAQLYPLHPAAIACLVSASRRFGQHDRSIFSFLQSSEPGGLQDFMQQTSYAPKSWYALDRAFDYLASMSGLRFDTRDRDRKWQLGRDAVDSLDESDLAKRILKAVALLAALEPVPGLHADGATLAWALGEDHQMVDDAIGRLVQARILFQRSTSQDVSLWSTTSIDLADWLDRADRATGHSDILAAIRFILPDARPVIAQRHYHSTGTLREFAVTLDGQRRQSSGSHDGEIHTLISLPGADAATERKKARILSQDTGLLALVHLRTLTSVELETARELELWHWVEHNCPDLRIDELARAEVRDNVIRLSNSLSARMDPLSSTRQSEWFYQGRKIAIGSRAELSRKVSEICDTVFHSAPILRNELINRNKLSTAIAAARMRLLDLMIAQEGEEFLGLSGAPPERSIYLSMFLASGMHRSKDNRMLFTPPPADDPLNWMAAWRKVEELVGSDNGVPFDELISALASPPFGLRSGPALLLIATVMLASRDRIALAERGTFQPELNQAHFMRLAKNPRNFALRYLPHGDHDRLLSSLVSGVSVLRDAEVRPSLKPVVETLFLWWRHVDDYARSTATISKTAQEVRARLRKEKDPITLLFDSLPKACRAMGADGVDTTVYTEVLEAALCEISEALPQLRARAGAHLNSAFGTTDLAELRTQIRADYSGFVNNLADYQLRAFVDRALNEELENALWLDGVASLLVSKRLENWDDSHLDRFAFEARQLAQRLARRLMLLREMQSRKVPLTAIHITGADGDEKAFFLHDGSGVDRVAVEQITALAKRGDRPDATLAAALRQMLQQLGQEQST